MTEAEEADPNAGAGTLGGTISDLSADRIVVLSDDGDSYYFSMYGADINLVNGMQAGNYVTVEYNGDIYGPDIVPATSISDNSAANGETAITITDDEGVTLSIDTAGATWYLTDGIASGAYVTIAYTGTLSGTDTTGVKGVAVYDTAGSTGNADTTADDGTMADDGTVADDGMVTDDGAVSDDGVITDDGAGADDGAEV